MEATILWAATIILLATCLGLWLVGNFTDIKNLFAFNTKKGSRYDTK